MRKKFVFGILAFVVLTFILISGSVFAGTWYVYSRSCSGGGYSGDWSRDTVTGIVYVAPGTKVTPSTCTTTWKCTNSAWRSSSTTTTLSIDKTCIETETVQEATFAVTREDVLNELNNHTYTSFEAMTLGDPREVAPLPIILNEVPSLDDIPATSTLRVDEMLLEDIQTAITNAVNRIDADPAKTATISGGSTSYAKVSVSEIAAVTQATDADFSSGTLVNTTIVGTGFEANMTLAENNLTGSFESSAIKIGDQPTAWLTISWNTTAPSGTTITLQTRTGDTLIPDNTWSPWSAAYTTSGSQITSPIKKYLQYRVNMTRTIAEANVSLADVTITYTIPDVTSFDRYISYARVFADFFEQDKITLTTSTRIKPGQPTPIFSRAEPYTFQTAGSFCVSGLSEVLTKAVDPKIETALITQASGSASTAYTWQIDNIGFGDVKAKVTAVCPSGSSCEIYDFVFGTIAEGTTRTTTLLITGSVSGAGIEIEYDDAYEFASISPKTIKLTASE